jgi:hypothetical protein
MTHASRLFGPLISYLSLVGLVILAGGLVAAGFGMAAAMVLGALDPGGIFTRVLAVVLAGGFATVVLFLISSASAMGLAPLVLEGSRARAALDRGAKHLLATPSVLLLTGILAAVYLGTHVMLSAGAFAVTQAAGKIASLTYQTFASATVGYLGLVGLAAILAAWNSASAGRSMPDSGISAPGPPRHILPPPGPLPRA